MSDPISTGAAVGHEALGPVRREHLDSHAVEDLHRGEAADGRRQRDAAVHRREIEAGQVGRDAPREMPALMVVRVRARAGAGAVEENELCHDFKGVMTDD